MVIIAHKTVKIHNIHSDFPLLQSQKAAPVFVHLAHIFHLLLYIINIFYRTRAVSAAYVLSEQPGSLVLSQERPQGGLLVSGKTDLL